MIEKEFERGDAVLYNDKVYIVVEVYHGWNGKVSSYAIRGNDEPGWKQTLVNPDTLSPCPLHRQVLDALDEDEEKDYSYNVSCSTTMIW